MRDIVKRFPGVVANDHVNLAIEAGEIHALLGENGAGKSTLMQILYGLQSMDSGDLRIHGKSVRLQSPRQAIAQGIGMVHQEFMLVHSLSVIENVILGLQERLSPLLDLDRASAKLQVLGDRHHLPVDPAACVRSLPMGLQQRVEILKLLYRDARVLILDEPTAVLLPLEKDRLFATLRSLKAEGRSVVIITHKLHEIMEIADRVTVMRDGRVISTVRISQTTTGELARLMVGREIKPFTKPAQLPRGDCILSVANLHVRDGAGKRKVQGLNLDVHAGEIVGIAGVEGNGQLELARAILHLCPIAAGAIHMVGEDITLRSIAHHRKRGLAYVPADRRGVGSVAELSIAENVILGEQRERVRGPFLDREQIARYAQSLKQRYNLRSAGVNMTAAQLSGGNLQKLILGREIMRGTRALVVEQPTRGLDAGAIESVWQELLHAREQGTAILLISADLEELLQLCDRIAVMYEGKIVGIVNAAQATMEQISLLMAGPAAAKQSRGTNV